MAELERGMSAAEFSDWQAYYAAEPWGEARADLRAGIIASTLANIHRRREAPPFKPADFMPFARGAEPEREPDPLAHFERLKHGR